MDWEVTRKLFYYGAVCILLALILANTLPWFIWQFGPIARIDIDL